MGVLRWVEAEKGLAKASKEKVGKLYANLSKNEYRQEEVRELYANLSSTKIKSILRGDFGGDIQLYLKSDTEVKKAYNELRRITGAWRSHLPRWHNLTRDFSKLRSPSPEEWLADVAGWFGVYRASELY